MKRKHAKKPAKAPQAGLHRQFHELLAHWNAHARAEVALHTTFRKGSKNLKTYLAKTVAMQKRFLSQVEGLAKRVSGAKAGSKKKAKPGKRARKSRR